MHINGISSILASLILGNVDFTYFCCFSWYASLATSAFTRSCYRFSELRFMLYLTEIWLGFSKFLDGDAWRSALFDLRSSRSLHHHLTSFGKSWHWVAVLGTLIVIDSSSMKIPKNFPKIGAWFWLAEIFRQLDTIILSMASVISATFAISVVGCVSTSHVHHRTR